MTTNEWGITDDELHELQTWRKFENRLKRFKIHCTLKIFEDVFRDDSERLFDHYRTTCNENFNRFLTYLTIDQKNNLYIYILRNYKND